MKTILIIIMLTPFVAEARSKSVRGYIRNDGTYVQPHIRSAPNNNSFDNYSTKGNTNPYTGSSGYSQPSLYDINQQPRIR